ncbi:MAG: hypothetical protein ACKO1Y_06800, partial [Actinomycetota bacterium]
DSGVDKPISGREADDRYNPTSILAKIGATIVFVGDVVSNRDGDEDWDRIAIVRYATRKSFIDMQTRNDFQEKHEHKEAGMERTIVMGTRPLADPVTVDLASRTADDVVVLRVQRRTDYTPTAAGSFAIEGTIVGDGRTWDHAHYERFPSHTTATTALATEADDPAIADAYVLVVRPRIDRIHPGR